MKAAGNRRDLRDAAPDGHRNQIEAANASIGRIEGNPAGPRQIDFHPSMGRPDIVGSDRRTFRIEKIARRDPGTKSQATRRFRKQHRKIPARSPAAIECLQGPLCPLFLAALIGDMLGNAGTQVLQKGQGICRMAAYEPSRPSIEPEGRIGILRLRKRAKIGPFIAGVPERIRHR